MTGSPVRIFIGSGEQSAVERRVLIHSLRQHTSRPLEISVFNGTHNALERNDEPPVPAPLSLPLKYRNLTEFSLYRYLIPEVCGFQGRAIYLDSDMVCLRDIGEFFDQPLDGQDFLAKSEAYDTGTERMWGLSAMLIDCGRCRFDLGRIFREIDDGRYSYADFSQMGRKFLAHHPYRIGEIDPTWNTFDRWDSGTKLIHYTNLATQPWKFPDHPYGELWFQYLAAARRSGVVRREDIELAILRGHVRPNLLAGNSPSFRGRLLARVRRLRRTRHRS